jgi:hypothetical protein
MLRGYVPYYGSLHLISSKTQGHTIIGLEWLESPLSPLEDLLVLLWILNSLDQRYGFGVFDLSLLTPLLVPPMVPPLAPSVSLQGCFARGLGGQLSFDKLRMHLPPSPGNPLPVTSPG